MKAILRNWRHYVIFTLFITGVMSAWCIFGEDDRALGAWIEVRIYLAIISAACFYTLQKLIVRWGRQGKIKEFTNQ